jgi:hypothetical protein
MNACILEQCKLYQILEWQNAENERKAGGHKLQ